MSKGFGENNGAGTIKLINNIGLGNVKGDYVLDLMKAGTFTNDQSFAVKGNKASEGGNIMIVDAGKQATIRAKVEKAIANMRQELSAKKFQHI